MKIISEILGNLKSRDFVSKEVDFFDLEWFETTKKILRKNIWIFSLKMTRK